jgi:hypothetical protein
MVVEGGEGEGFEEEEKKGRWRKAEGTDGNK